MKELYEYLKREWFNNLTDYQIHCYSIWMTGKLGPFF